MRRFVRWLLALALLVAAVPATAQQTVAITSPEPDAVLDLGYDDQGTPAFLDDTPRVTGIAPLRFAVSGALATDKLRLKMDAHAPVSILATSPAWDYPNLPAGAHTVTVELTNASGTPYRGAVAVTRFYLGRVCDADADCDDGDPCTRSACDSDAPDTGGFRGACRFAPDRSDADCCVTSEWCRLRGLALDAWGLQYQCADVDGDGTKDCVECTGQAHCQAVIDNRQVLSGGACVAGPICTGDHRCRFSSIGACCQSDDDCLDGDPCTTDTCVGSSCVFTPVVGCCVPGEEDLPPGPPDWGCARPDDGPCTYRACLGSGTGARCRSVPVYAGCCAAADDCADPLRLDACSDPDGVGHGVCAGVDADPRWPGAGVCKYEAADPACCTKTYECADRWPEELGTCQRAPADAPAGTCMYAPNPEYCVSPVDTVVITEVMVDVGGPPGMVVSDFLGEWFEVFNPTDRDINLDGWTVHDLGEGEARESFTIDNGGSLIIPAGGFRLFGRSSDLGNGHPGGFVYGSAMSFNNWADAIVLRDPEGVVHDVVAYDETWPWREQAAMALVSPYLDNADPASWRTAERIYGHPVFENRGTPRYYNADVFDATLTAGLVCDDGDPCTVDLCNLEHASVCSHPALRECCMGGSDAATVCNDGNACTADSCDLATNRCRHERVPECCLADADCRGWYPAWVTTPTQQDDFDRCAWKACIAGACRHGRNLERPGCCVSATAPDFGCRDRNVCTVDACVPDGGQDPSGVTYDQCRFDLDLDADGVNDCCALPEDCDDGDPLTLNTCDLLDDGRGPGPNRCWYKPDSNDCGPGADDRSCDDRNVMTVDVCCTGVGEPEPSCPAADRCVHRTLSSHPCQPSGRFACRDGDPCTEDVCVEGTCEFRPIEPCCRTHADCNGSDKPAELYCRTGYCISHWCRFGPPVAGCCVTAADCPPEPCATPACVGHVCAGAPVPGCCAADGDCPQPADPCLASVCDAGGACVLLERPGCCAADADCDDGSPCTADLCRADDLGRGVCRHVPSRGPDCCAVAGDCPDDRVACTDVVCESFGCALAGEAFCDATLPYRMTFTEGHAVYVGEYRTLADLGWTGVARDGWPVVTDGFGFATAGPLGPDRHLAFTPPAAAPGGYVACAALPALDTGGVLAATLRFRFTFDGGPGATLRVLGTAGTDWAAAEDLWATFAPPAGDVVPVAVPLPPDLLGQPHTRLALCLDDPAGAQIAGAAFDDVSVSAP